MKTDRFLHQELQKIDAETKKRFADENEDSLIFHFDEINFTELLDHIHCEKIFFFKSKYENFCFLGLGHSKTIMAHELAEYLLKNPSHFLIAALQFEENPHSSEFILPEWMFVSSNKGNTELSIHPSFEYKKFSSSKLFFNQDSDLSQGDSFLAPWQSYEELPEHDQWSEMIKRCDTLFDSRELDKIVLSRKKIFEYEEPIPSAGFFKAVMEKNNNANSSYAIYHQISFDKTFISLSPEKLFSINQRDFQSISLAASAPRGTTLKEDQAFEEQLQQNDKLSREHNFVTEEILRKIKPLSESVTVLELQTMKLPYIQHRAVPIYAKLLPSITALPLLALLHPTPAVGGLPSDKAQVRILELEPYTRQYYAAPIGVISAHYSEWAVGIRSALIEGSKLTLFGGAGIVKGSNAEEEWIETGMKMNPFLKVVNHE